MRLFFLLVFAALSLPAADAPADPRYSPEMAEFVKRFKGGGMLNEIGRAHV